MPIKVVQRTPELKRILLLPRRDADKIADEDAIDTLTAHFKTPRGTMRFRPVQAAGLIELHDTGGWFGQAGVGQGKTLITLLAAMVIVAKRPLLIVPAKIKRQTERDLVDYSRHWKIRRPRIETYQVLGRRGGGRMLRWKDPDTGEIKGYHPDLIILDEAHRVKNPKASATRKLNAYIRRRRKEGKPLWVLLCSGTLSKRAIEDFAHFAEWTHPNTCPLPQSRSELKLWGKALNEGVAEHQRVEPGALRLFNGEGDDELECARRGVQRRIFETPGFLATKSNDVADCSLVIECHQVQVPLTVDKIFANMKLTWESPRGDEIDYATTMYMISRQLSCGFFKRWDPQPPKWWLLPRKEYNKAVRYEISHNQRELHSPDDVKYEILRTGPKHPLWEVYSDWMKVKPKFTPNSVPVWIDDFALEWVAKWVAKNTGIIWVEWPDFGRRIAQKLRLPYYGQKGLSADKMYILDERGDRSIVASINANNEGLNLQKSFSKCLFTSAPPTGLMAEQTIGRIHRPGQLEDEVQVDYMIASREQYAAFEQSLRDANFHSQVLGSEMKLLEDGGKTADIIVPDFKMTGGAWASPSSV